MGTRGIFIRQPPTATADAVVSASSEDGLTTAQPVASSNNLGALQLRASGVPTAVTSLDFALTRGGMPIGGSAPPTGGSTATTAPGAALRFQGSSVWRGHTYEGYLTYARTISDGDAVNDYPRSSKPRTLPNDSIGFVRVKRTAAVTAGVLQFVYKSSRTGSWTTVTVSSAVDTDHWPDFVVTQSDRLLAYALETDGIVHAYYSDDSGATWAEWSADVGLTFATGARAIHAECVGDAVCVATTGTASSPTGVARVHWSQDGGQYFLQAGDETTEAGNAGLIVTATGVAHLLVVDTGGTNDGTLYPLAPGGGPTDSSTTLNVTADATHPCIAMTAHDDGSVWIFYGSTTLGDPISKIYAYVSYDNCVTFAEVNANGVVFDNKSDLVAVAFGYTEIRIGSWHGSLVCVGVVDGPDASLDDGQHELWFGGWDAITESPSTVVNTDADGTDLYAQVVYTPVDLPHNVGWTEAQVGGGASRVVISSGLRITAGGAFGNSKWTAHANMWGPTSGDCHRFRFVFQMPDAAKPGSLTQDVACLVIQYVDGAGNKTFLKLRFTDSAIRALDSTGALATSASVAQQFAEWTEVLIAIEHATSATESQASAWYRIAGSVAWTNLLNAQILTEGVAGANELWFGGDAIADSQFHVEMLAVAEGGGNLPDGFTSPGDLRGRPLSPSIDYYIHSGVHVGAFGGPGVKADTYTFATTYQFAARNLWLADRPSRRWQSSADNASTNIVFGGANDTLIGNCVLIVGSNVRALTWQMNATDAWGGPSFSASLDATLWAGRSVINGAGYLRVDGAPFVPHEYRSQPGRRFFLEVVSTGDVFEITDNNDRDILVTGLSSAYGAVSLRIFGDRMGVMLPATQEYKYARILIGAQQAADNKYRIGTPFFGPAHEFAEPYDSGFVDEHVPNVQVFATDAGYTSAARRGGDKHRFRIAWAPMDRLTTRYLDKLSSFLRALDGERQIVGFWRDLTDQRTIGAYRVRGPVARENVYGEAADELARLAQLVLTEELP